MSEKRFIAKGLVEGVPSIWCDNEVIEQEDVVQLLNELHEENQLLKCALALDAITNISLNDKKIDIPPYYEFENYQQLKKERREEYDEYW